MGSLNNRQSGFGAVGIAALVAVVVIIGVAGFGVYKTQHKSNALTTNTTPTTPPATPVKEPDAKPQQPLPTTNHYSNDKYGISFDYPKEWSVEDGSSKLAYLEPETILLNLILVDTTAEGSPTVATVAVSTKPLSEVGPAGDGDMTRFKQQLVVKGKQAVKYSIPQTETVNREMYFIASGNKTYWIHTFNEEAAVKHSPDYASRFNTLVESVTLTQ